MLTKLWVPVFKVCVIRPWFAFGLGLLVASCSWLPSQKALQKCRFEPLGYSFTGVDKQGIHGDLQVKATNPGKTKAKLSRMKLWLLHDQDTLAHFQLDTAMELPAESTQNMPLDIIMPFSALPHIAGPLAKGTSLECQMVGDAWVDTPFGTYRAKNALRKSLVVDLAQASSAMYQTLGLPWLKDWIQ